MFGLVLVVVGVVQRVLGKVSTEYAFPYKKVGVALGGKKDKEKLSGIRA